eukprot:PITA_36184
MDVSYDCELNLSTDFEPASFKEAASHDAWKEVMQKEYDALIKNDTWKLVDPPLGTKPIGCKWVYKSKYKADGSLDKHKARLVAKATKEIVWLRKILEDLQLKQVQSTPLMIDNTSAIKLAKNPKFHDRTKHINTKYHMIRHHVETKTIYLRHCSTNEKIADIFTKALGREKLERFRMMLGLTNIPSD